MGKIKKLLLITSLVIAILILISVISYHREEPIEFPTISYKGTIEKYRPTNFKPMRFGTHLDFASYSNGFAYPLDAMKGELVVAEDVGVDTIRLDISYDAWLYLDGSGELFYNPQIDHMIREKMGELSLSQYSNDRIRIFDEIIEQIKADGRELMIADAAAEQYWGNPMEWEDFKIAYLTRVQTLAGRYHPGYYVVVKEPSWYMGKWGTSMTTPPKISTAEWLDLTGELCRTVKRASPNTKCAVAISLDGYEDSIFSKTQYIIGASKILEVDILGFDIYNEKEFEDLEIILPGLKGKELWILETWTSGSGSTGRWWMSEADAEWIKASVYYAQDSGMDGYVTFYTQHFILYEADYDVERFSEYLTKRTPAYYTYKDVIAEVRSNAG